MFNLVKFIVKYHFFFLFFILELTSGLLIVQNNRYHKAGFINAANFVTGNTYAAFSNVTDYVRLKKENENLAAENAALRSQVQEISYIELPAYIVDSAETLDTLIVENKNNYKYHAALVISNATNKIYNTVYLNKGLSDGIREDMGVVNSNGAVGIIVSASKNFAIAMPIISKDFSLSAKIKDQGYFGKLLWDGKSPLLAKLVEIPNHVELQKGDTIVTSGYSHVFPEGVVVGYVEETAEIKGSSFLDVTIRLAVDFSRLEYIYAIENKVKEELISIQNHE